jgi:hypothetical protein
MYKQTKLNTKSKMKTKIKNKNQKIYNRRRKQIRYRIINDRVLDHLLMYHYLIGTYDDRENNNTPSFIKNARKYYDYEWKNSMVLTIPITIEMTGEHRGPITINPRDFYGFLKEMNLII